MRATVVRVLAVIGALALCAAATASLGPRKAIRPADQARAKKIALSLGDLPHGWLPESDSIDNGSPRSSKCVKVSLADLTETADFTRTFGRRSSGHPGVVSAVGMLKTRAQADELWRRAPTAQVMACSARAGEGLPKGSHVSFRRLTLPRLGNRSAAWQLKIEFPGLGSALYDDIVYGNKGRTFDTLNLAEIGSPFDPALARRLVLEAGARLNRYAE